MAGANDVQRVVNAGGGYAGLPVALRPASCSKQDDLVDLTLVDCGPRSDEKEVNARE